jgi:UDP-GlcNAc:undecaprenyl-phosphate GlcNAc-1-phosphate transferase
MLSIVARGVGLMVLSADDAPASAPVAATAHDATRLSIVEGYIGVLMVAFMVTLCATPIMRRVAVAQGVIDRPNEARKIHRIPIAYLGGVAVYLGIIGGLFYAVLGVQVPGLIDWHVSKYHELGDFFLPIPLSIVLGMTVIMMVGLIDDVTGISPRVKLGGQLFAAAGLAVDNVGVKLAAGLLMPMAKSFGIPLTMLPDNTATVMLQIPIPFEIAGAHAIPIDIIYWVGTAIIAIAVLGLCNASNLVDGLDGLLSGTTAIAATGLLVVALGLAVIDDGPRDSQRIILCLALLGACLGFLPHNFNPANIFLGDAGSLLLGFVTCVIILMMGDTGKTSLVVAGLMIYAIPVIDTTLAIIRRKMEGKPISAPDDQHLHHMLKRALGVKGAVLVLYGIAATFAALGASITLVRARMVYFLGLVLVSFVGVTAIKIARKRAIELQAAEYEAKRAAGLAGPAAATTAAPQVAPAPAAASQPSARSTNA